MDISDMPDHIYINSEAFSSGQISSKLWLCEQLENIPFDKPQIIWIYGGWYGILSFLLLSRQKLPIKHIRSFDIDLTCEPVADKLLENWVWQEWKFKAVTTDCNLIQFDSELPDIIINCATEHFDTNAWFDIIPSDTLVVMQSNNMQHDEHRSCVATLEQFEDLFPLDNLIYSGKLDFKYPTWEFSRFMMIGNKP